MFMENSIFKTEAHTLEFMNDPAFWRTNYIENQTDALYSYKNTTYKKWVLTDIEHFDFIVEIGNEILPAYLDKDLNKSKLYTGKGIYIIEEFNFSHERLKHVYKAIIRRMLMKKHYEGVKDYLIKVLDELNKNETVFPFKFIITMFIDINFVTKNEYNDLGEIIVHTDIKHNYFENIDEDVVQGSNLSINLTPVSGKGDEEFIILGKRKFKIKSTESPNIRGFIIAIKNPNTDQIYERFILNDSLFTFMLHKIKNVFIKLDKVTVDVKKGLNKLEETILKINTGVLEEQIKARKEVIELTINSLKSMFAENKVMQSALNVVKEELSVEKEELSKNKEIIKTAGETVKTFS